MSFEKWFEKFQERVKDRSHPDCLRGLDGEDWARAAWNAGQAALSLEILEEQQKRREAIEKR